MELPVVGLVPKRLRWRLWGLLTRSRRICPANSHSLLIWGYKRDPRVDGTCRRDCAANGTCYCGNLRAGVAGPPPWWRWFEPPKSWPRWLHLLTCTFCREMGRYGRELRRSA